MEGTYDSSGKLLTQIQEGLECSIFMSAAAKQMTELTKAGYIDGSSVVNLLENKIVLIAPNDLKTTISSFEDIVKADSIALGDPESVPAGQYAQEVLTNLGIYDEVATKASLGSNVTEVLNSVAEGSADAGIVYATDAAQMKGKVKIIADAPEGSQKNKVIYSVGILSKAPQREAAKLFVKFLQSSEAMHAFKSNGFKCSF